MAHVNEVIEKIKACGRKVHFFNINAADAAKRADVTNQMQEDWNLSDGDHFIKVVLHSVAFGSLLPYISDQPDGWLTQAQMEITKVLDDWHDAASKTDEERYFGHFAKEAVFLGTDATERWDVPAFRAYAHPFFSQGKAWSFRAVRRDITVGPPGVAWFDEAQVNWLGSKLNKTLEGWIGQ